MESPTHPRIKSALETGCMASESTAVPPSLPRGGNGKAVGSGCSRRCHGYKNGILTDPLLSTSLVFCLAAYKMREMNEMILKVPSGSHTPHCKKKSQEKLGGPGVHLQNQHTRTSTQSAGKETGLVLSKTQDSDSPQRGGKLRGGKSQLLRETFTKNSADWE